MSPETEPVADVRKPANEPNRTHLAADDAEEVRGLRDLLHGPTVLNNSQENTMTQEEANVVLALAEAEKAKAHARLMNAQAEQMENENRQKASTS